MAQAMEAAGVDACYLTDHPAPDRPMAAQGKGHDALDPFTAFGFVAASTTKLMMHTNILVMAYRNPFLTAKAAATLQVLSGGRLILGAGAGYQKVEFEALGRRFPQARQAVRRSARRDPHGLGRRRRGLSRACNFNAAGNEPRPVAAHPAADLDRRRQRQGGRTRGAAAAMAGRPFFAAPTMSEANQESGIHTVEQLGENIARAARNARRGRQDRPVRRRHRRQGQARDRRRATAPTNMSKPSRELAEVGVTWTMIELPHPSRAGFIENVQWFGEEVIAKLRG